MPHDEADPADATRDTDPAGWHVRRAGLLDVNRIARMVGEHRPFIDLDGDGEPDEVPHPEHAEPATRMVLSLGGLEHGELWLAEPAPGAGVGAGAPTGPADPDGVLAVAVWLPPDTEHLAADLHRVIARELDVVPERDPEPAHAPLRSIVGATSDAMALLRTSPSRRVLVLLADDRRATGERRLDLLGDLLAPVLDEQGGAGRDVLAVTVDPAQVADLRALGFAELGRTPLGAASLWLGVRHPGGVGGPGAPGRAGRQAATATV